MTKQKKLRHSEYYDLQPTFDKLYVESGQGKTFTGLMDIIRCEENIRLAYRNIKKNGGSNTAGTDGKTIYAAQHGKCAVTGKELWIDEIHCHHKVPIRKGGTDRYDNLILLHKNVHKLIHATTPETIQAYLGQIESNRKILEKINALRLLAGNASI